MKPTLLPTKNYCHAGLFLQEQATIFKQNWLVLGHVDMIAAGQVRALRTGQWSILLARDPHGELRAFHNICRHRAGPLAWEGAAPEDCRTIRCKYHGWSYDWAGALHNTPGFGEKLPMDTLPLMPLACAEHHGLILVRVGGLPEEHPTELEGVWDIFKSLSAFCLHREETHTLQCNWKVYAENYLEGYHIPYMHPALLKSLKMSSYQIAVHERCISHHVDMHQESVHEGYWVYVWPNTAINIYGKGASIERMVPISVNETQIVYQYLFLPDTPASEKSETIAESELLTKEDQRICEAVQRNLQSGAYTKGYLAPEHERGVLAFQQWVMTDLQMEH